MPFRGRKQYDNSLSGAVFENDRRSKDGDPDMKGTYTDADGNEFWVAAWWNQHAQRGDYLKLKMTPKESDDRSYQQRNNDRNSGREDERGRGSRTPQYGRGGDRQGNLPQNQGYSNLQRGRAQQETEFDQDGDIPFDRA